MKIEYIAFTDAGEKLAGKLAAGLGGGVTRSGAREWARDHFGSADALVFVGAAGIAVRAIAPLVKSKAEDPAVVVVDEAGRWAVPILSGHLGGANALAVRIASITKGEAVLTTATDVRGKFAVDLWAKKQGLAVRDPENIVRVSSKILKGEMVLIRSDFPILGQAPEGVRRAEAGEAWDAEVSFRPGRDPEVLHLIPETVFLGIGCRKGVPDQVIDDRFRAFLAETGLAEEAFAQAATIDRKKEEEGLLAFAKKRGLVLKIFRAEELETAEGTFHDSPFVRETVGTGNVCERAAALAAGPGYVMVREKFAGDGVTLAAASAPVRLTWEVER